MPGSGVTGVLLAVVRGLPYQQEEMTELLLRPVLEVFGAG